MLEGLAELLDKSLLRQEEQAAGETRFWMLQTLREFGLEHLARCGGLETTRQAHAEYYLRLAEEAQPSLQTTRQARWMTRPEQEHENLRAALGWLFAQARGGSEHSTQQAEHALRFCSEAKVCGHYTGRLFCGISSYGTVALWFVPPSRVPSVERQRDIQTSSGFFA